ncbi:prephenate dehydrogenase [Thiogranum longum]|uniref:prephenate dehydrogenase n=1 Tax=Thiogranum longum TaxID=1537524 RepID=A0A4R1H9V0_9GAMM|nr:prephenate dehydrogenase/arogenate dehydrogenase family protein [Thiogranum longum]TCK18088.1 prephenate dehydrogenase [Thiogranum longum]
MIRRLCIIGVGLIGGSLARALREAGYVEEIVGSSRREEHLQEALDLGVIDRFDSDPARAVEGADMVFVAVPLGAMGKVFESIAGKLATGAVVTDGGSAKASVVRDVCTAVGDTPDWFVPGHPIAGTEQSGVAASFAGLYQGRRVILTPLEQTRPEATARVRAMWEAAGATVNEMSVEHHDEVLAATSHLPHMLAFALVESLARLSEQREIFEYAAGGFTDFTRIASSDPVMWRDICIANRDALLKMLERFNTDLETLHTAIDSRDEETLLRIFTEAKVARDAFSRPAEKSKD